MDKRNVSSDWQLPSKTAVAELKRFYRGFYISEPAGNNAFSYEQRHNKKICVAPLVAAAGAARRAAPASLAVGAGIAFSEIDDEVEVNRPGLDHFLYLADTAAGQDIFIFDNHNHAFFFWMWAVKFGRLNPGRALVHVDQHRDLREPQRMWKGAADAPLDLEKAFAYTNSELNVGNFLKPALAAGVFSDIELVVGRDDFERELPQSFALDIDMDIFSEGMRYIPEDLKLERIREWLGRARVVTIATSPFFMDQERAIQLIQRLLS